MPFKKITVESLVSGEQIALGCLELLSIPHVSIIDERQNAVSEVVEKYKSETIALLNEVYQSYKTFSSASGYSKDISFELLWTTHEVKNQPFKAEIKLHIVVRAIDTSESIAKDSVSSILSLFKSTLSIQKYDYTEVDYKELSKAISSVKDSSIKAIVKEEKVESLQNQLLPYCFAYDRIPVSNNDLSRIVNVLIDYPDCAVSLQLIPTVTDNGEAAEIDRVTQALETLSKGVMDQGIGNVSFALADTHAKTYRYYSEHKTSALFIYNILVYGNETAVSNIAGRVFGQLSTGKEGSASLKLVDLDKGEVDKDNNFYPLPWAVNEILINKDRNYQIWSSGQFSQSFYRLPFLITAEEE